MNRCRAMGMLESLETGLRGRIFVEIMMEETMVERRDWHVYVFHLLRNKKMRSSIYLSFVKQLVLTGGSSRNSIIDVMERSIDSGSKARVAWLSQKAWILRDDNTSSH